MKTNTALQLSNIISHSPHNIVTEETEGSLDFSRSLRSVLRHWWIVGSVMALTTAAAGLKVLTDQSMYVGTFEVLIQPGSAEADVISNIPGTLSAGQKIETIAIDDDLLKILRSPKVLEPVVREVETRYPRYCKVPESLTEDAAATNRFCYEGLTKKLNVSALKDSLDKNSTIVNVTFRDSDPQAVQFVLAKLSEAYLAYSLEVKQAEVRRGLEFVEQKLPDLRARVNFLQNQLQDLRLQNNIIDPISRAGQLAEQIGSFSQEQFEIGVQLEQTRAVSNELGQQLSAGEVASSSALNQNPRYQALLNSLLELDSEIAEASTLYLDSSPDMQVLEEQRRNLLVLLSREGEQSQREVVSQIRELESREQALSQTLQALDAGVDDLTGVARSYDDIQRELQISTENLNQFIAKREALEIDAAQSEIPWELVTPPMFPKLVQSDLPKYLLLGGSLGLLLGVGLVLLIDESSGVIHSTEELKQSTRLPVIGSIPTRSPEQEIVTREEATSMQYATVGATQNSGGGVFSGRKSAAESPYGQNAFAESFRSLYTNIRLLSADQPVRAITVSSVMPSEGKSTVALHLAKAAASMGQKVLLVDADLRNPQVHTYLNLSNEKGLTNLFSGESNPALIQKYSPESNLHVITAGSAPFEPTRLFSSRSMRLFTQKVKTAFDLVIYDTPPLLGQSDAYLVADHTDGMLLVSQPGKLKQPLLDRAMEQLRIADINVLGLVTRE